MPVVLLGNRTEARLGHSIAVQVQVTATLGGVEMPILTTARSILNIATLNIATQTRTNTAQESNRKLVHACRPLLLVRDRFLLK